MGVENFMPPPLPDKRHTPAPFSVLLRVVAFVFLIAGIWIGFASYEVFDNYGYGLVMEKNYTVLWMWILIGVFAFIMWWALSYIVDACIKYLNRH